MNCFCNWKAGHLTSSIPGLENTPRQKVFLQKCLTGQLLTELEHCGLQVGIGGLEKRVILEQPHKLLKAPTLRPVLSLLDHTGNTGMMESSWMLKEMQRCISMKVSRKYKQLINGKITILIGHLHTRLL